MSVKVSALCEASTPIQDDGLLQECPRCDYRLDTQPVLHNCPECGTAIDRRWIVLRPGKMTAKSWRAQLVWGFVLITVFGVAFRPQRDLQASGLGMVVLTVLVEYAWSRLGRQTFLALGPDGVVHDRGPEYRTTILWGDLSDAGRDFLTGGIYVRRRGGNRLRVFPGALHANGRSSVLYDYLERLEACRAHYGYRTSRCDGAGKVKPGEHGDA